MQAYDLFGWSAEFLEWLALYLAARNEQVCSALLSTPKGSRRWGAHQCYVLPQIDIENLKEALLRIGLSDL